VSCATISEFHAAFYSIWGNQNATNIDSASLRLASRQTVSDASTLVSSAIEPRNFDRASLSCETIAELVNRSAQWSATPGAFSMPSSRCTLLCRS
jgi:hypothetical protein